MIIKEPHNVPVASPQIQDMAAALVLFRTFRGEPLHTMAHLLAFLAAPSAEREAFLGLFATEVVIMNNRYAKQTLTIQ